MPNALQASVGSRERPSKMAKENSRFANNEVAIGIDLGTTYTCCAVWRNGGVEMIPNENGNTKRPVMCPLRAEKL